MLLEDGLDGDTAIRIAGYTFISGEWRSEKVLDQLNGRQNQSA